MKKSFSPVWLATLLLLIPLAFIVFFMVFDRTLKRLYDQELVYLQFRFFLTLMTGGIGVWFYRSVTTDRDLRSARRADLNDIYTELKETHREATEAAHDIRASLGYDARSEDNGERTVDSQVYQQSLKTLIRCRLTFRFNTNRTRDKQLGYQRAAQLAELLAALDTALHPLIEEYEAESIHLRDTKNPVKVKNLPELADFVSLESRHHPLSGSSLHAFNECLAGLSRARHE